MVINQGKIAGLICCNILSRKCYNKAMNDQVTAQETTEILRQAEQRLALDGDFVELGCYKGMTSVLLGKLLQQHLTKNSPSLETAPFSEEPNWSLEAGPLSPRKESRAKRLFIYDSFAGLPEKTVEDATGAGANFQAGELLVTKREVVERIRRAGLKNVIVKKAWFNELQNNDLPEKIAFAFCDGDLYDSIKTSLKLVVPRLAEQGIIIVHDYNNPQLPGSARAVDEFLRAHSEYQLQVRYTLAILTRK